MTDYPRVLGRLRHGAYYGMLGAADEYNSIDWRDSILTKPTQAECDAEWILCQNEDAKLVSNDTKSGEARTIIESRLQAVGIQRGDGFLIVENKIKAYVQNGVSGDTGTTTADIIRRLANVAAFALAGLLWLAIRQVIEE